MAAISIPHSFIEVVSPNLPDGFYKTNVLDSQTGQQISQTSVNVSQNKATVKIDSEPNKEAFVLMTDFDLPPKSAEVAYASTIGDIELYANETFRIYEGYFDYEVVELFNGGTSRITTHEMDNGFRVSLTSAKRITISPNGAFDHLDKGESERMKVPYTTEASGLGADLWDSGTLDLRDFTESDTRTYTPGGGVSEMRWMAAEPFTEGAEYEIHVTTTQSGGSIDINWLMSDGSVGSGFTQYMLTKTGDYDRTSWPAPAGAQGLRFRTSNGYSTDLVVRKFGKIEEAEEKYLEFVVKASEEVSAKLVQPDAFSGTNWTASGDTYTATGGDTAELTADFAFEQGKIYEISATVANRSGGSIKPALKGDTTVTGDYSLATDWREVWYLRAPANATQVAITQTGAFDGEVSKIYVRELFCQGVDDPASLEVTSPQAGKLKLKPLVVPMAGRRSESEEPEFRFTGEPNYNDEYGVRITDQSSYVVEDAYFLKKRSSISTKGGTYAEIWNTVIEGRHIGDDGIPETADDKYVQGVITSDNSPIMFNSYVYNCEVDLKQPPMPDNYSTSNSDCYLFNSTHEPKYRTVSAYLLNNFGGNASDGIIDNKQIMFVNHMELVGGHRTIRGHGYSQALIASSSLEEVNGTQAALHAANIGERFNIWNCTVNGQRVVSEYQLREMTKDDAKFTRFSGEPALQGDANNTETRRAVSVLKTFPRMPAEARLQISDWEWEISPAGAGSWSSLIASDGLFDIGTLIREVDVPAGTYDVRFKARHGEHEGNWLTVTGVVVS